MLKLPKTNFKLDAPYTKEKTLEFLHAYTIEAETKPRKTKKYTDFWFWGTISDKDFLLTPIIQNVQSFLPELHGNIQANGEQTLISVNMQVSKNIPTSGKLYFGIYAFSIALLFFIALMNTGFAGLIIYILIFLLSAAVFFGFIYYYEVHRQKVILSHILDAEIIEK